VIYLCRHGQTEFNREGRIQGQSESPLTPLGERQAGAMADLLQGLRHHADPPGAWRIVASPLGRARATAGIIGARLRLPVQLDLRLAEVAVGAWEGRLREDVRREHPEAFAAHDWFFHGPGGETYDDVLARVGAWLGEQSGEDARRVIVVSHGVAGRLLRGAYAGLAREAVLAQDIPQDAIFRLAAGRIERLTCAAVSETLAD
jgi:broad specificity phosphatase PhoE